MNNDFLNIGDLLMESLKKYDKIVICMEGCVMAIQLIYFSGTGSTQKVVRFIGKQWQEKVYEYDLSNPHIARHVFSHQDLCIVGVPSYGGRVPTIAIERLKQFKANQTPVILVVTYGNRHYDDTFIELKDTLQPLGFICVGAMAIVCEHSIVHEFARGRPNTKDFEYIQSLVETLKRDLHPIEVPGHRPYKIFRGGLKPLVTSQCTKCGLCAKLCPVEAIDLQHLETTNESLCISCMRCISICPFKARICDDKQVEATRMKIQKVCTIDKQSELIGGSLC